jgi:hypothetical protein
MARRRFVAPARGAIDSRRFDAAIFSACSAYRDWWLAPEWPGVDTLNRALGGFVHPQSGQRLHFVEQDAALLEDGLHFEARIHARGAIATRACNWHDLFNAAVWCAWPSLKAALNARQAADVARVGPSERTRAQCALTHFDEAGAIVRLRDPTLLEHWNAHDWRALFWDEREAWRDGRADVIVIGHALLEHALAPEPIHTAKCAVVLELSPAVVAADEDRTRVVHTVADAVVRHAVLNDPQELRPLPLSGIPGWHPRTVDPAFYAEADCFRPLRAGREYPAPLRVGDGSRSGGAAADTLEIQ